MYIDPTSLKTFVDGDVVVALDFNMNFSTLVAANNDNDSNISTLIAASGGGFSINVKSTTYGAKGDGVTNDTTAIQNAINYAIATGVPVYFPRGNYVISDSLVIQLQSSLRGGILYGEGNATLLMSNTSKPSIDVLASANLFVISGINFKYTGTTIAEGAGTDNNSHIRIDNSSYYIKNVVIDNCYFDTTEAGLDTGNRYVYAINAQGTSEMTIKNCVFAPYTESAIKLKSCSNTYIKNNHFQKARSGIIALYTGSVQSIPIPTPSGMYYYDPTGDTSCYNTLIDSNTFLLGGYVGEAVLGYRTVNLRLKDNDLYVDCVSDAANGVNGTFVKLYGVINGSSSTPVVTYRDYCQQTLISGNKFYNSLGYLGVTASTRGALFLNNQIDATVANNNFLDMGNSAVFGIPVDIRFSYNVVVSDNHFTRCRNKTFCLYMSTVVGFTVRGNVFLDAIYGATDFVGVFGLEDRSTVSDPYSVGVFTANAVVATTASYRYTYLLTLTNGNYGTITQNYVRLFGNQVIGALRSGYMSGSVYDEIDDSQVLTWMGAI